MRSGPFSRVSNYPWAQCARWLISSVVAPATWLLPASFFFSRSLFPSLPPASSLPLPPTTPSSLSDILFLLSLSLRTFSRSGPVQRRAQKCFYSRNPSTWFILNRCVLSLSLSLPDTDFKLVLPSRKNDVTKLESSVALWSLYCIKLCLSMKIYCKTHWIVFFSNLSNALTSRRCQKFLRDCVPQTIAIRGDDRHRCEPIYLSINTFAFKRTSESYIYIIRRLSL